MQASTRRNLLACPNNFLKAITLVAIWLWMPAGEIRAAGKIGQESAAQKAARFPELYRQWEELKATPPGRGLPIATPREQGGVCAAGDFDYRGKEKTEGPPRDTTEAAWLENPIKDERAYHFLYSFLHVECVEGRHAEDSGDCRLFA